ncbi:MAG: hypothetical protein K2R98_08575 [Gemmataceae bacterium]|nr:hypothetical protein [Gemmataceae bacterium]
MIAKQSTRQLYESLGPTGFVRKIYHALGLANEQGKRNRNAVGNPEIRAPKGDKNLLLSPREFSLKDLAEAVIGEDWSSKFTPDVLQRIALQEEQRPILEAGTNAVTATAFANINAFTSVVTGLLEISVMEGWQNPEFIADQLMPSENTRMFQGRKVIGTTRLGDVGEQRTPGMPTKRAGFGERWIQQPSTVENALSCEVTQEAVYLDLTGEVLDHANSVGEWIGYRKEIRCIDAFIGAVNTYSYKGTSFNTYISAGYFDNFISAGNELVDHTNIELVLIKFRDMLDVETGTRVQITPNRMLVNQEKLFTARAILGATETEWRGTNTTYPGGGVPTASANVVPQGVRRFPNPVAGLFGQPLASPLVYQRMTDTAASGGLALSATAAGKAWFVWEYGKPFKYAQNWPLRVQQAAPNQLDMIDRGIVLFVKADERGIPMVYEPRRIVQSRA